LQRFNLTGLRTVHTPARLYINGVRPNHRRTDASRSTTMAFSSRTLAVFVFVILASLAFVAHDALAARALAQTYGTYISTTLSHFFSFGFIENQLYVRKKSQANLEDVPVPFAMMSYTRLCACMQVTQPALLMPAVAILPCLFRKSTNHSRMIRLRCFGQLYSVYKKYGAHG
jgi:hypothetical protein